ncbi:MAG: hypothetical protein RR834_02155 [Thermomonas sp.]
MDDDVGGLERSRIQSGTPVIQAERQHRKCARTTAHLEGVCGLHQRRAAEIRDLDRRVVGDGGLVVEQKTAAQARQQHERCQHRAQRG